jgi:hypothetical protein
MGNQLFLPDRVQGFVIYPQFRFVIPATYQLGQMVRVVVAKYDRFSNQLIGKVGSIRLSLMNWDFRRAIRKLLVGLTFEVRAGTYHVKAALAV